MAGFLAAGLCLLFAGVPGSSFAGIVEAYDQSFSITIPDAWVVTSKEAFKQKAPDLQVEPVGKDSIGLPGLIISHVQDTTHTDLKTVASVELEQLRARHLPQNNPSPTVEAASVPGRSEVFYYFRTGDKPDNFLHFYFSLQGESLVALCPNVYETDCKRALATITPSAGSPGKKFVPKFDAFSIRVPPEWTVTADTPKSFAIQHPPQDTFQVRKPSAKTNRKSQPDMEKALQKGMRLAYPKLRIGPSHLQSFLVRGSVGNKDVGRYYYVTGIDANRGNVMSGYLLTEGNIFLVVAESRRSQPIEFVLPLLSTWENK